MSTVTFIQGGGESVTDEGLYAKAVKYLCYLSWSNAHLAPWFIVALDNPCLLQHTGFSSQPFCSNPSSRCLFHKAVPQKLQHGKRSYHHLQVASSTGYPDLSTLTIWSCDTRFQPSSHDCFLISRFLMISNKNLEHMSKHPYFHNKISHDPN